MNILNSIKYFVGGFEWMRTYNSPFRGPVPKFYIGKVTLGVPYFLPRRWVNVTEPEARIKAQERFDKRADFIRNNPKSNQVTIPFDVLLGEQMRYKKSVPKKIGFDFVSLGWKTKFDEYRFEWSPMWSFVFFKWQIAVTFVTPKIDHYWECWLQYRYRTNKSNTTQERLEQARKDFPCEWTTHYDGVKESVCYWDKILKKKWL